MKITFFDLDSIGNDLDLSVMFDLGDCVIYKNSSPDEVKQRIIQTEVAVINKIKLTAEVLENARNLRLICVAATGYDNIDVEYCREHNIAVANVPGYSTNSVALVTVSTVLSLMTRLRVFSNFVRNGGYTESGLPNRLTPTFNDLQGKTWGIVGYGNIGKKIGEIARAFGCNVIYSRSKLTEEQACRDIDSLCRESDIITLSCPLNEQTRNLINAKRLGIMKSNVVLVNAARGAVCDEAAVAQAVKAGTIGAFGCDVYSVEPFPENHPFNEIKEMDNVCLTPHIAWASFEARTKVINEMAENIAAFYRNELRNRVEI